MSSSSTHVATAAPSATPLRLELLLQINIATLVVLSTLLLSTGQQNLLYALLSLAAAITAVIVTDLKGYFWLSPAAANAAALGAFVLLVLQIIQDVGESQLLNVANILIYLEIILLLQKKEERTYWALLALSLLQVIVAAALNLGLLFAVLLALYVLAAVSALTLFFVLRETEPFASAPARAPAPAEADAEAVSATRHLRASAAVPLTARPGETADLAARILNRSFRQRLARMLATTALLTVFLFFALPRFSRSVWESPQTLQVATVGFTEEVRLDDIGRILENPEQVMRVEFTTQGGVPYEVVGEPYFRGTVLSHYKGNGSWRQSKSDFANKPLRSQASAFDLAQAVVQRYALQPGSHSVLFHIAPCYPVSETADGLQLNAHTRQLTLADDDGRFRSTYRYVLGTTALRNGWQKDVLPVIWDYRSEPGEPAPRQLNRPEDWLERFPSITLTASRVLAEQGLTEASAFDRAKALEGHFRSPDLYRYSLEMNQTRDPALDPVEDFVRNHRTGHCEYFASALTLMLRSQGIPAHLVVGFKGGEYNTVGNYYIVRQLHAHAWVEAYLAADQIGDDEIEPVEGGQWGAWLRLDPTPGGLDNLANRDRLLLVTKMRELVDYMQVLWDDYVLGLNSTRQQQAIYGPLVRSLRAIVRAVLSRAAWRERWQNWRVSLGQGLVLLTLALMLYLLRKPLRRWRSQLPALWPRRSGRRGNHVPRVDFYERLLQILARRGYRRPPQQTPLEFAAATGLQLAEIAPTVPVAGVPRRITDAFYRVRFGGQSLSAEERTQLKLALADLDQALRHMR